ncbi:hypothetical protein M758_12G167000 [Ceratodon purpureus]|nr:hypothetical protein M758_12G167000 [Ceratodon purpureus]
MVYYSCWLAPKLVHLISSFSWCRSLLALVAISGTTAEPEPEPEPESFNVQVLLGAATLCFLRGFWGLAV